jgi:deoxycytidylate deaminase
MNRTDFDHRQREARKERWRSRVPAAAVRLLPKATHKCHKHAAVVYRGGAIVAMGYNHDEVHAEVSALNKLWPSERRGTRVVSIRMSKGGNLRLAKPCVDCEAYMRANGVKMVIYSDNNGNMVKERY